MSNNGANHKTTDPDAYVIVDDPDKECGYRKGAIIFHQQLIKMLLPSYAGFTPGTILKNKAGALFVVVKKDDKFALIPA